MLKYFLRSCAVILLSISLLIGNCFANAVDFNGDSDYINLGDDSDFDFNDAKLTIFVVMNNDTDSGDHNMFSKYESSGSQRCYSFGITGGGDSDFKIYWHISDNGSQDWVNDYVETDVDLSTNTWYAVGVTQNGADAIIYDPTGTTSKTFDSSTISNESTPVRIGCSFVGGASASHWNGSIAVIAVWSETLSAADMNNLMNAKLKDLPLQIRRTGTDELVGCWFFDDLAIQTGINNDTFKDSSALGNNGTGVDGDGDSAIVADDSGWSYSAPILP